MLLIDNITNTLAPIIPQLPEGVSEEDAKRSAAAGAQTSLIITIVQVV